MSQAEAHPAKRRSLSWINRDGKLILMTRGIRSFGYGFLSVLLAIYLKKVLLLGEGAIVGAFLSAALIGSAGFTLFASVYADRIGRRKMLIFLSVLMALSGVTFTLTKDPIILFIAAAIGTLSPTGAEIGSFLPMEQAILPQCCTQEDRNPVFAAYNVVGTLSSAGGSFFAGIVDLLPDAFNLSELGSYHVMFALYAGLAVWAIILYLLLSRGAEVPTIGTRSERKPVSHESKVRIAKLSSLFATDSFAGGFVLMSIIALWFNTKWGVPVSQISLVFGIAGVLTTISYYLAVRIAKRIGLLRTMVFTHIPSNILLILVPFAPTFLLAIAFFLARQSISQMDVPTRQSYTVAIVPPEERMFAAGVTSVSRNLAQAVSPSISTQAMEIVNSAPFVIGGSLKIVYDVAVYFSFRNIRPPEESNLEEPKSKGKSRRS